MTRSVGNSISENIHLKMADELARSMNKIIFMNTKIIDEINEAKTVYGWYREAKEKPDRIPTIMLNEAIKRLVEQVEPVLSGFLIQKINLQISGRNSKIKTLEVTFEVKPFVDYIRKVDKHETDKVRITFSISIVGTLEDITIYFDSYGKSIFIKKVTCKLDISIISATVSSIYVSVNPLSKPIPLYHSEVFKIENVSFRL
jgi:hypothetical protein